MDNGRNNRPKQGKHAVIASGRKAADLPVPDATNIPSTRGTPTAFSVGVVDDDAIVRVWVRQCLEPSEFWVAGEASTAAGTFELLERRAPALLLVDYRLPDYRGTELVRKLRQAGASVPVLLITAAPEEGLNEAAREAGAQGVVLKRPDREVLLTALRVVVDGGQYVEVEHPRRPTDQVSLSRRERDVLRAAARGATNAEIANDLHLGRESVKTLLSRSFVKLGSRNRMEAVEAAREQGLL